MDVQLPGFPEIVKLTSDVVSQTMCAFSHASALAVNGEMRLFEIILASTLPGVVLEGCRYQKINRMNALSNVQSLHETALAVEKSNRWPFAYALGYASGKDDAQHERRSEHSLKESDDYAKGYHKGFSTVSQ